MGRRPDGHDFHILSVVRCNAGSPRIDDPHCVSRPHRFPQSETIRRRAFIVHQVVGSTSMYDRFAGGEQKLCHRWWERGRSTPLTPSAPGVSTTWQHYTSYHIANRSAGPYLKPHGRYHRVMTSSETQPSTSMRSPPRWDHALAPSCRARESRWKLSGPRGACRQPAQCTLPAKRCRISRLSRWLPSAVDPHPRAGGPLHDGRDSKPLALEGRQDNRVPDGRRSVSGDNTSANWSTTPGSLSR